MRIHSNGDGRQSCQIATLPVIRNDQNMDNADDPLTRINRRLSLIADRTREVAAGDIPVAEAIWPGPMPARPDDGFSQQAGAANQDDINPAVDSDAASTDPCHEPNPTDPEKVRAEPLAEPSASKVAAAATPSKQAAAVPVVVGPEDNPPVQSRHVLRTPYKNLIPAATPEEDAALLASIEDRGMDHGPDVDELDNILDGHRRYAVAPELAYCKRVIHNGLTEGEKQAWVFRRAVGDHRNLDRDQQAAVRETMKATAAALKGEGKTQVQVARLLGVAQSTISSWALFSNITADNAELPGNGGVEPVKPDGDKRKKLTAAQKKDIVARAAAGESQTALAGAFTVSKATISGVIHADKEPIGYVLERFKYKKAIAVYRETDKSFFGKKRSRAKAKEYPKGLYDFFDTEEEATVALAKFVADREAKAVETGAKPGVGGEVEPPSGNAGEGDTEAPDASDAAAERAGGDPSEEVSGGKGAAIDTTDEPAGVQTPAEDSGGKGAAVEDAVETPADNSGGEDADETTNAAKTTDVDVDADVQRPITDSERELCRKYISGIGDLARAKFVLMQLKAEA